VHSPTSSDRSKKENANGNNIGLQELIQMNEGIKSRYEQLKGSSSKVVGGLR
jgi:hypothetical protein